MLIGTPHGTVLSCDYPDIVHRPLDAAASPLRIGGPGLVAAAFASHWEGAESEIDGDRLRIRRGDRWLCALPDGTVAFTVTEAGAWEEYRLIDEATTPGAPGFDAAAAAELTRFAARIDALAAAGRPVRLHFGALWSALDDFLNIDLGFYDPGFIARRPDDYFAFPYVGVRLPIADAVADYIYHEDFLEHIDQLGQIQFLAETRRLLKPGGVHRVNTPDLVWIMRRLSDFDAGVAGVYSGERRWGHTAMLTRGSLEELARLTGYRDVRFTPRGESGSPYRGREMRPLWDRDPVDGSLYADLIA